MGFSGSQPRQYTCVFFMAFYHSRMVYPKPLAYTGLCNITACSSNQATEAHMRNPKDRRVSHAKDLFGPEEITPGQPLQNRRKTCDRRIENLTLEERQLQLSEMPSLKLDKKK
jgi:hypothetical protein